MKNLFVLFAATLFLVSCKKEPVNINNNYITVIGDTTTTPVVPVIPVTPVVPGSLIDSSHINTSNDTSTGVWATNATSIVRTLSSSAVPTGSIGVEFAIEFTINTNRQISFSSDQSLQLTANVNGEGGGSNNIQIIATGATWARIRMARTVIRTRNSTNQVSTKAYVEYFYYAISNVPIRTAINLYTASYTF